MQINEMQLEDIEARRLEIEARREAMTAELETAEDEALDAIKEEAEALNEEERQLEEREAAINSAIEQRKALLDQVRRSGTSKKTFEGEKTNMRDITEYRDSSEYIDLYAEYLKTGDDAEIRAALLSTNATGGTIPVPTFVHEIVKTAWEKSNIMRLVERVSVPGNYIVPFEISGDDAVIHTEGSAAVTEEALAEGMVTLIPEYAKKWKSFSKTIYALRGRDFVEYMYDEITYRVFRALAKSLLQKIAALPAAATATAPAAAKITGAPAIGLIAEAMANLSDEAEAPVVVMNKLTWGAFKQAQYAGAFDVDPFEGLEVIFNNSLPAYSAASSGDVYAIVGDFGHGALANFPNGEEVEFTFDNITRKKENLIEVLGELMVGVGPVACNAFALIAKGS